MIVYLLLNVVTEKAYVGATDKPLEVRWRRHLKDALTRDSGSRLHQALRNWPLEELWERVVLQRCGSLVELSEAEDEWMSACDTRNVAVGYNDSTISYARSVSNGRRGGDPTKAFPTKRRSPLATMSDEQRREFFRQTGRRGASTRKGPRTLTEEERERYREWGRMGAARSRELASERPETQTRTNEKRARKERWAAMSAAERHAFLRECGKRGAERSRSLARG